MGIGTELKQNIRAGHSLKDGDRKRKAMNEALEGRYWIIDWLSSMGNKEGSERKARVTAHMANTWRAEI